MKNKQKDHNKSEHYKNVEQIVEGINQETLEVLQELKAQLFADSIPTPMQTDEQRMMKCEKDVAETWKAFQTDLKRGFECYTKYALPEEKEALGNFFGKIFSYAYNIFENQDIPLVFTEEDLAPLDVIATRTFAEDHFKEASCMWRLIIQQQPANSRAWVGWALAEQMNGHLDIVNHIYRLGLSLFPHDFYIALFAADFYLCEGKTYDAQEIIDQTIEALKQHEDVDPEIFKSLNEKLEEIKQLIH